MKSHSKQKGRVAGSGQCSVEALEPRQLLAAGPAPVLGADGVLRWTGTSADDRLTLTRATTGGADRLRLVANGKRYVFATASVRRVDAHLAGGDDKFEIAPGSARIAVPLWLDGGGGDDTLTGASGADRLLGGDGEDSLVGGPGDDAMDGGLGDDHLLGGRGDDRLTGSAGDDWLIDDEGSNDYRGGVGRDVVRRNVALPPEFIIGVWGQTSSTAWRWKQRGVNTMVAAELWGGKIPMAKWDDEVRANGMYAIRQPSAHPENDGDYENLIAWLANDEPDVHHTDPNQTTDVYEKLKRANPDLPVFMNFSGGHVVGYQEANQPHPYRQWLEGADWSSNDIYPVAGWNLPDRLNLVGQAVDKLRAIAPKKPQFAFIETSDQGLPWNMNAPGPTPAQLRAEIWNAVIHGVRGIVYFSDQFKPVFNYNATPPDVEAEMIAQNAKLKDLSPALMSAIDPKGYSVKLPPGMEGTVRRYNGKTYVIALNLSGQRIDNATLQLTGVKDGPATIHGEGRTVPVSQGRIVDSFDPLTPRVYVVG